MAGILVRTKKSKGYYVSCGMEFHQPEGTTEQHEQCCHACSHYETEIPEGKTIAPVPGVKHDTQWNCTKLPEDTEAAYFMIEKVGPEMTCYYSLDGDDYQVLDTDDFFPEEDSFHVGLYGACPMEVGCKAVFEDFKIEAADD